jgi:hypothetical protein
VSVETDCVVEGVHAMRTLVALADRAASCSTVPGGSSLVSTGVVVPQLITTNAVAANIEHAALARTRVLRKDDTDDACDADGAKRSERRLSKVVFITDSSELNGEKMIKERVN